MSEEDFTNILIQAVDYDKKRQLDEALACYKEGIGSLLKYMAGVVDKNKLAHYQIKVDEYFKRAEEIKAFLKRKKEMSKHIELEIKDKQRNCGYKSLFYEYMDSSVVSVIIKDPYIGTKCHTINLLKFIEALIFGCGNLKKIELLTKSHPKEKDEQINRFLKIQNNLSKSYNIEFSYDFSSTLHDRIIILSNGWTIKIGRGLDYFYTCDNWNPGYFDLDLRECRETTVDIFYEPVFCKWL